MTFSEWLDTTDTVLSVEMASRMLVVWKAATRHEREACAKVCEAPLPANNQWLVSKGCADAIRARSDKEK